MAKNKGFKEYKTTTYGYEVSGVIDANNLIVENEQIGQLKIADILKKFDTEEVTINIKKTETKNLAE